MATLTNTQISVTYVGLLKTSANTVLTSTAQQITDGDGNNSIMFLSTAGVGIGGSPASGKELDVTGNVQVTGDLIVDNITIDGSTITNSSGDLTIVNTNDDGDILLQTDNGSGGTTTYLQLDGGSVIVQLKKDLYALDNVKLRAGNAGDLQIYHDATDSYIENDTGDLIIRNNADDKDIIFQCDDDSGGTTEYFRLDGVLTSIAVSKNLLLGDNVKALFGTSSDLQIYHDNSNSFISDQGTGTLKILSNGVEIKNAGDSGFMAFFGATGASELYFNTAKKFETTSTGVKVQSTGTATLTLLDADDSSEVSINHNAGVTTLIYSDLIFDNGGGNNVLQLTNAINALENITLPDSKKIILGTGSDLQLFHNGSHSFIQEQGTGDLRILSSKVEIFNAAASETMAKFTEDSAVELYHNGSKKFETTSTGATVTGVIAVNSGTTDTAATFTSSDASVAVDFVASDNSMQIATSSTDGILKNNGSGSLRFFNNGSERVRIDSSGNVGIGTTSPSATLEVAKGSEGDYLIVGGDNSSNGRALVFSSSTATSNGAKHTIRAQSGNGQIAFKTGTTEALLLDSSQNATFAGDVTLNNELNFTSSSFQISGGTSLGDMRFVAPRFRFYEDSISGTAKLEIDGGNANFAGFVNLADSQKLRLGDGADLTAHHSGTDSFISNSTGHLTIQNSADDKDILFLSDDGSGGTAEYMKLDGSDTVIRIHKRTIIDDSVKFDFGNGQDLQIYHDGSNSYIDEVGTGSLFIRASDIFIKANATENAIIARANAEVELYHNGSEKFATTSTGATVTGALDITGALSKGSGSFKIDHPVKPDTHYLYHSFVESPLTDLIYRGKSKLVNGKALINIDKHFGMTEGTFEALADDKQVFTTNEDSWDAVRGKIEGNELHIECQNKDFDGYVSWLVIGDRKDKHIMEVDWTDDKGKPILEIEK